jgi:AraC-like DNA-binding protein
MRKISLETRKVQIFSFYILNIYLLSVFKMTSPSPSPPKATHAWLFIICLIFVKMMLATARRNLSPFVPYLASSLNVDVQVIAIAIASQRFIQIVTLPITPYLWNVFASCGGTKNTEKKNSLVLGKARVMVFAVVFLVLCLVIIAYGQNLYLILIFIGMSGAAKAWFDPSGLSLQRDVLRDATPRLRGVAAAGTEFNWGLASLVGVPISGLLLSISFTLPFLVLAVATTIMLVPLLMCNGLLYRRLPQWGHRWWMHAKDTTVIQRGRLSPAPEHFVKTEENKVQENGKKYRSSVTLEVANGAMEKLQALMQAGLYKDSTLTLKKLAHKLDLSQHHLSQIINEQTQGNYYDLINLYRINEAKRLLVVGDMSIIDITYEAGFNSKSSFYTEFRRQTNGTPGQFKKIEG